MPIFDLLVDYCSGEIKHDAFHTKYASKKYLKGNAHAPRSFDPVANIPPASLLVRQWSERYVMRQKRHMNAKR
jgi:hypothetical protein